MTRAAPSGRMLTRAPLLLLTLQPSLTTAPLGHGRCTGLTETTPSSRARSGRVRHCASGAPIEPSARTAQPRSPAVLGGARTSRADHCRCLAWPPGYAHTTPPSSATHHRHSLRAHSSLRTIQHLVWCQRCQGTSGLIAHASYGLLAVSQTQAHTARQPPTDLPMSFQIVMVSHLPPPSTPKTST